MRKSLSALAKMLLVAWRGCMLRVEVEERVRVERVYRHLILRRSEQQRNMVLSWASSVASESVLQLLWVVCGLQVYEQGDCSVLVEKRTWS